MNEKKHCPYCGEEILAVAKKCKHCGEWLTERTNAPETALSDNQPKAPAEVSSVAEAPAIAAPAAVPPTSDDLHVQTFLTPYAWLPLCLGILGSVLSLFEPAVGILLTGFTSLILFYAFYEGMKRHAKPVGWSLILVIIEYGILCIAATAIALYPESMEDADEPSTLYDWIFSILFVIPWGVLGFKLIRNYSGNIARLGWAILLLFIVEILSLFDSYVVKIVGLLIFIGLFRFLVDFDEVKDKFLKLLPLIFGFLLICIFRYTLSYTLKYTSSGSGIDGVIDILDAVVSCYMFYCFYRLIKKKEA